MNPLFEVLTESASARLFDAAFAQWLQEQLATRRKASGGRCAYARSAATMARSTGCARRRGSWRSGAISPAPGCVSRSIAPREIDTALGELHAFAELTRRASSRTIRCTPARSRRGG